MPSKIFVIIPGARVTEIAPPVETTSSPGFRPEVSSKTWIVVCFDVSPITSPTSLFLSIRFIIDDFYFYYSLFL